MVCVSNHEDTWRRVRRTAQIDTGSAWVELPVDGDQKLVYDRWNVIQVLDANNGDAVVRTYTWGLDLSGLSGDGSVEGVHGAGGIGGLLAVEVPQATGESRKYGYLYDGNGNVVQLVAYQNASETATLATHYEYDAYGRTAYAVNYDDGSAAGANPFRFSTKWLEDQPSANGFLYYFGYRYYSPRLGRWVARDPLEDPVFASIEEPLSHTEVDVIASSYAYTLSNPVSAVDPDGAIWVVYPRPIDRIDVPLPVPWIDRKCSNAIQDGLSDLCDCGYRQVKEVCYTAKVGAEGVRICVGQTVALGAYCAARVRACPDTRTCQQKHPEWQQCNDMEGFPFSGFGAAWNSLKNRKWRRPAEPRDMWDSMRICGYLGGLIAHRSDESGVGHYTVECCPCCKKDGSEGMGCRIRPSHTRHGPRTGRSGSP